MPWISTLYVQLWRLWIQKPIYVYQTRENYFFLYILEEWKKKKKKMNNGWRKNSGFAQRQYLFLSLCSFTVHEAHIWLSHETIKLNDDIQKKQNNEWTMYRFFMKQWIPKINRTVCFWNVGKWCDDEQKILERKSITYNERE